MLADPHAYDEAVPSQWLARLAFFALILAVTLAPTLNLVLGIGPPATGDGNVTRVLIYAAITGASLLATVRGSDVNSWWPIPVGITICILYFAASLTWALNLSVGVRRFALTCAIIWNVFALLRTLGIQTAIDIVRALLATVLVVNFATVFALPSVGLTDGTYAWLAGSWQGILGEKNHAGAVCALTILIFLFDAQRWATAVRIMVVLAASYFLYRSNSKTSLGLAAFASLVGVLFRYYRPYYRIISVSILFFVGAIGLFLIVYYSRQVGAALEAYMDDPETLTGRVQIWSALWDYFENHWLLGSGFGSFWNIGALSPIFESEGWITEIASGHNGYLDILVQVGAPGLFVVIWFTVIAPVGALVWFDQANSERAALTAALLILCLAHNFTESTIFDRDSLVFVFLLLAIACTLDRNEELPHASKRDDVAQFENPTR
jgi:O-antigen ligase